MIQETKIKLATHGYFVMTLVGFVLLTLIFYPYCIGLFGCHTTYYMFLTALLVADWGAVILARILFIAWPVYSIAFIVCYLVAVFKKKYVPLGVIASIDVLFSSFVFLRYLQLLVFPNAITSLVGMGISFVMTVWLFQANQQRCVENTECENT